MVVRVIKVLEVEKVIEVKMLNPLKIEFCNLLNFYNNFCNPLNFYNLLQLLQPFKLLHQPITHV